MESKPLHPVSSACFQVYEAVRHAFIPFGFSVEFLHKAYDRKNVMTFTSSNWFRITRGIVLIDECAISQAWERYGNKRWVLIHPMSMRSTYKTFSADEYISYFIRQHVLTPAHRLLLLARRKNQDNPHCTLSQLPPELHKIILGHLSST